MRGLPACLLSVLFVGDLSGVLGDWRGFSVRLLRVFVFNFLNLDQFGGFLNSLVPPKGLSGWVFWYFADYFLAGAFFGQFETYSSSTLDHGMVARAFLLDSPLTLGIVVRIQLSFFSVSFAVLDASTDSPYSPPTVSVVTPAPGINSLSGVAMLLSCLLVRRRSSVPVRVLSHDSSAN